MSTIRRFLTEESGATAIEYCFIAGSIALLIVAGVTTIGTKLLGFFTTISGKL